MGILRHITYMRTIVPSSSNWMVRHLDCGDHLLLIMLGILLLVANNIEERRQCFIVSLNNIQSMSIESREDHVSWERSSHHSLRSSVGETKAGLAHQLGVLQQKG